jgi:hypothetical protein
MSQTSQSVTPNTIQTPFCGELRSKKFFLLDILPTQESDFLDGSGHCWCYHTQQPIGPDGRFVGPDLCGPGRACYRSALSSSTDSGVIT